MLSSNMHDTVNSGIQRKSAFNLQALGSCLEKFLKDPNDYYSNKSCTKSVDIIEYLIQSQ